MSHLNFVVKVPSIPRRPIRRKKLKSKASTHSSGNLKNLDTIQEAKNSETKRSSYYSFKSESSESNLKVLEMYDEFLNLKDIDDILWKKQSSGSNSEDTEPSKLNIKDSIFLLKQICADLKCPLDIICPKKEYEITSIFQTKSARINKYDIKTAIIAKRIADTQEQLEKSRGNSRSGFSKESLRQSSFNKRKSTSSMGTIDELPCSSTIFNQTLSNLTSKYGFKRNKIETCDNEIQVDLTSKMESPIVHSCNTQTESLDPEEIAKLEEPRDIKSKIIQTSRKTRNQFVQSSIVTCQDKYINTDKTSYPSQERFTQMYEHITENDLFCMEWINRNLFRVPVNPDTVIVDEKLKDSSEYTCKGTSFFEQELTWERQALCL